MSDVYRYEFLNHIEPVEIEAAILLSILAAEDLHGQTQTLLGVAYYFDADDRTCVVDATSEAGRDFNRLFAGFVRREFGEASFRVDRIDPVTSPAN